MIRRAKLNLWSFLLPVVCLLSVSNLAHGNDGPGISAIDGEEDEYLVGVYYFSGWWRELPNKYHVAGKDWREDWPERRALLGEFNDQPTMDREIVVAAEHGVDFFQFLWYDQQPGDNREQHQDRLNAGLNCFLASPEAHRLEFTIEYVNHPPFGIGSDGMWAKTCAEWCEIMKHLSYLRIDGRPVFKVHGLTYFQQQNDGKPEVVARRLATLTHIARDRGLNAPMISGGIVADENPDRPRLAVYDFLTTYMAVPPLDRKAEVYPYDVLIRHAEQSWAKCSQHADKMYVPYLPAGWDPRPWKDPRPSFEIPDRRLWLDALRRVRSALDTNVRLGIPKVVGRQKALLIYAWNEYGEGGFIAPTQGQQTMKLECIREVFGTE